MIDELCEIEFTATISLSDMDIEVGEGNYEQAVQNVIGGTGAKVIKVTYVEQP